MRNITVVTTDDREMHFIPENTILEARENPDGTTTLAFVCVINVKSSIEEIRTGVSKSQAGKVRWGRLPQKQQVDYP